MDSPDNNEIDPALDHIIADYETLKAKLRSLQMQNDALVTANKRLRHNVTIQRESLTKKNRELDAMHWIWCSGGCKGGAHRFTDFNLTEEVINEACARVRAARENKQRPLPPDLGEIIDRWILRLEGYWRSWLYRRKDKK